MKDITKDNYLNKLFIDEAKPALNRHGFSGDAQEAYNSGVAVGIEQGKQAEYDAFWDAYQDYGKRTNYSLGNGGFSGKYWTDEMFKPKYPMMITNAAYMFRSTSITDLTRDDIKLDFSKCTSFSYAFGFSSALKHFPTIDMSIANECVSTFSDAAFTKLSIIVGEVTKFNNTTFSNVKELTDFTIAGVLACSLDIHWSTKLSHDSLMSIINVLKDYSTDTSGTEWKVTLGNTNIAKLTDEELAIAYRKGWTVA